MYTHVLCISTRMYIYIYIYVYTHIALYTYMYVCMYVCMYAPPGIDYSTQRLGGNNTWRFGGGYRIQVGVTRGAREGSKGPLGGPM